MAAAGQLRDAEIIRYVRGHIQILNSQKLEAGACECYAGVKDEYERLLTL